MREKRLPAGWVITSLKEVLTTKKGKKPLILRDSAFENAVPYLDIKALEKNEIRQYADIRSSNILQANDIAILWDGARSGWVSKGKFGAIGSTLVGLKPILVNTNFIFFFLKSKFELLNTNTRGSGIPHVDPAVLWNIKLLLPPLAEQNRIVEKLDKLFASLEIVKTKLDSIPIVLKDFRQAILSQAISGDLTRNWRDSNEFIDTDIILSDIKMGFEGSSLRKFKHHDKINEVFNIPKEWQFTALGNVCLKFTYGTSQKSEDSGETVVLRMGNLQNGKIDWTNLKYTSDKGERSKYLLSKGDVLFNRTNSPELVGKTSVFDGLKESIYAGYLIKIWNDMYLDSYYLNLVLNSNYAKLWCNNVKADGVSQSNINAQKLSSFLLPLPSIKEQQQIVLVVDNLFIKALEIERSYLKLKDKFDNLPQSILAKAFSGDLVSQISDDEPASELLLRIKELHNLSKK